MIAVKEFAKNSQRKEAQKEALSDCLEFAIGRLRAEDIYNHPAHGFKESGDRLRGGCPFHQSNSGSSFVVTISSKLFWCAGCQVGGSPVDYRASLQAGRWVNPRGKDFVEVVRELAADANVSFPELEYSSEAVAKAQKWERRRAVLAATQKYCQNFLWSDRPEALKARQYLVQERGLTEEEIKQLPIGYYSSAEEIKKHLISKGFSKDDWKGTGCVWQGMEGYITFLWHDATGRPLTIYGRYYEKHPPEGKPKTIAAPGTKTKQSPLYLDRALKAGHKEVVLVEGVLDTVLLQAKGDNRVCAYVAASCSDDQIDTLKRRGITRATLCGDPDHGGERGTNSNLRRLTEAGISVYIAPKLPDGLDPDEFLIRDGMEGWKAHIDAAEHGFRWKAKRLIESGDVTTDKGKAEILQNAIAFCKLVKNHPELDIFFWTVIRSSLGMEPEEFRTQLEKLWESSPVEVPELGGGGGGDGGDGGDGDGGDLGNKVIAFSKPKSDAPTRKEIKSFCQKMYEDLFEEENYIYVFKQIHKWTGTHYEPIDNAVIIKQIHDYCDEYEVFKEDKETGEELATYPYADPKYVNKAFEWIKQKFGIAPKLVNPPGLNCVDGVLQLSYDPDSQKWIKTLVPHDPSFYYLYAPQVSYEIPAILSPDSCERLLSCLDAPQREIFLRTIAAALDLPTVRRYRGREIRGLLLHGFGNNGKDTLREVTAMLFGYRGMVSASLSDFQQYDQGRKFPLQKLDGALVNWPSENADCMMLDRLQSLKIAITGDPLSGEKKGKDEYLFRPRSVNLFNINALPRLQGAMEAIASRFSILQFTKTYKTNPAPGELQADPRFLYDPEFVRTQVLPWYLHYCLDALDRLMIEGINYDVTDEAWEDLREETDHIYAFCRELGIGYKHNGQLGADEVYSALRDWYIENGALEIEELSDGRKKDHWSPNPAWGDNLIKGRNQIFSRLLKIFPQARRERDTSGRHILLGVGWIDPSPVDPKAKDYDGTTINVTAQDATENVSTSNTSEDGLKMAEDGLKMVKASLIKASEDAEDDFGDSGKNKNFKKEGGCDCGGNCPVCIAEEANNLAKAWLRCDSASEVRELTARNENLKVAAWKLLTEDGRNHVRKLLLKANKTEISKNESPAPNHVQHLQNAESVRAEASSGDIQLSSEHIQKSSLEIQIPEKTQQMREVVNASASTVSYYEEPIDQSEEKIREVVKVLQGFYKEKVNTSEMISEASKAHKCTHDEAKEVERRFEEWKRGQPQIEAEKAPLDRGEIVAALREVKEKEAEEQSAAQGEPVEEIHPETPLDMGENIGADPELETQTIPQEEEVLERNQVSQNRDALYRVNWSFGIVERCLLYVADFGEKFYTFFDTDRNNKLVVVNLSEISEDWFEVNPG